MRNFVFDKIPHILIDIEGNGKWGRSPKGKWEMGTLPKQSKFSDKRIACICFKVFPYHSSTTHQSRITRIDKSLIFKHNFFPLSMKFSDVDYFVNLGL